MLENKQEYINRRNTFLKALPKDSVAIIAAANECLRNGDSYYPYRQNSDFYYLTGFKEPEAVAVFIPGHSEGEFILFCRARDPERETWDGKRAGQEGACSIYGANQSFSIESLNQLMPSLLENRRCLYYQIGRDLDFNKRIFSWIAAIQKQVRKGIRAPQEFWNVEKILHAMRLHKTPVEIEYMRKAIDISIEAHRTAMQSCKPGMREYELESEIQRIFTKRGSRAPAYNHIIGAGNNSCVLHYNDNDAVIQDGDIVLMDVGAEYASYAADITRTFPANGRFTPYQRAVYEAVLKTQLAVIETIRPGLIWNELQTTSERILTEELVRLELLQGNVEELIAKNACQRFSVHRIGHWLGMDVHDAGSYRNENGQWRALEPGMVFTVEPGIYIPAHSAGIDSKWWGIGVRIEDDVLVTPDGYEVLSAGLPKTIEAIEALMARGC